MKPVERTEVCEVFRGDRVSISHIRDEEKVLPDSVATISSQNKTQNDLLHNCFIIVF